MKTTVELPDDLFREVKIRAARENRKLKVVLAEVIERGLAVTATAPRGRLAAPVKLPGGPLSADELKAVIAAGRD